MYGSNQVLALIPARNEAQAIGRVLRDCRHQKNTRGRPLFDEIIVCDNGSVDQTAEVARPIATVVKEIRPGYGSACLKMLERLKLLDIPQDTIIVFIDGDASVNVSETGLLLHELDLHDGLVIGMRKATLRENGAMTTPQIVGNSVATWLIKLLFGFQMNDLGPFRAISYANLLALDMQDLAFGWTVEMQLKSAIYGMPISEVAVSCQQRIGRSKISGSPVGVIKAGFGIIGTIIKTKYRSITGETRVNSQQSETDYSARVLKKR